MNASLTNHFCTPEQAKRLKSLGVVQKSLFYYKELPGPDNEPDYDVLYEAEIRLDEGRYKNTDDVCSAFMSSELGLAIDWDKVAVGAPYKLDKNWSLFIMDRDIHCSDPREVVARANALITLIENQKIDLRDVNYKLAPVSILKTAV